MQHLGPARSGKEHDMHSLGPPGSGWRIGRRRRCVLVMHGDGGYGCAVENHVYTGVVCGWDIRKDGEDFSFRL